MKLNIDHVEIDRERVLKFLGYGSKKPPSIILKKLEEELEKAEDLLEIEVLYRRLKIVETKEKAVLIEGGAVIESGYAAEELAGSSSVYAVLYTVGQKIEKKIAEHSSSAEMIRAMILDKIGIVALDFVKERIKESISREIGMLHISAEIYPSQGDFDISNQKTIYELLSDESNSISINSSSQFIPLKTVAAIFGIGETECSYGMCDRCESKCDKETVRG
ncbi:vitamin B12 dependent methionine synthase, activation domain [Andreesenia angusta]|uniref:Vitamin B12 dependent methionine synthase, activation domain n=1 Tax=Andreesenia angusta TaxID=39480 RepID=A0A1S1V672_9FIRM|nr:hypothetical protein [Andreesenia angusta]OHW62014.1 vitamin B12 dependent methionine synthase, activation domain [Andreesenia angusta]